MRFNRTSAIKAANIAPAAIRKIATAFPDRFNLAGGQAFGMTPKFELAFALLTTFLAPSFYASPSAKIQQIQEVMKKVNDPMYCAKAAIFARTQYGMRSCTHLVAAEIAKTVKGQPWAKHFYNQVVYRVDDANEILAAYLTFYGKPIPNSLKKGLKLSLGKFNAYQLAKYKQESGAIKLVDLFNLVHPIPNREQEEAFQKLMKGELASDSTWEAMLSAAGSDVTKKAAVWRKLIVEDKNMPYFALLRNLRNIIQQGDQETIDQACDMLVNRDRIKKSLVLPFRFLSAIQELAALTESSARKVIKAVNDAVELSLDNVPVFKGKTLVALDSSGSMGPGSPDPKRPANIGALFCAAIARTNDADVMLFDSRAQHVNVDLSAKIPAIKADIYSKMQGGSTDFRLIFDEAKAKYDRIIILSDMQAWVGGRAPLNEYATYCKKFGANPKIYCFDLTGHGSLQFPQQHVFALAGFSDKTMDLIGILEENPNALVAQIEAIQIPSIGAAPQVVVVAEG